MKKILITGVNSYIGVSFEKYINDNFLDKYAVNSIDMVDGAWKNSSFKGYDVVFHVAGIAHSDSGKISSEKEKVYRAVNTDLAIETAKKAKAERVKQFIFMSSAIVYGNAAVIGKEKTIKNNTVPTPANCYGDSKLQAEIGLQKLEDKEFKVVILRPPMIYGKGCKGNFLTLEKLARTFTIFPKVKNQRSMLYVGNLVEFVRLMVENEEEGIFWPQNAEYSNTSELVKMIAEINGRKVWLVGGCSLFLKMLGKITPIVNKAFGNMTYERAISEYKQEYCLFSLKESIEETER